MTCLAWQMSNDPAPGTRHQPAARRQPKPEKKGGKGRRQLCSSSCRSIHFNANNSYKFMCNLAAAAADMQFTRRQIDRLKCATAENLPPLASLPQCGRHSQVSHSIRSASPITVVQSAKKFINLSATHLLPTVRPRKADTHTHAHTQHTWLRPTVTGDGVRGVSVTGRITSRS